MKPNQEVNIDSAYFKQLLVKIPAGTIEMRDDRIKEKWTVDIDAFFLSKILVTQALYLAITQENPSTFKGNQLPVETVSWKEAVLFCNKLSQRLSLDHCYTFSPQTEEISINAEANGFRLPTEAEWQYACQADSSAIRYGKLEDIAWYKENADNRTQEVGKKKPNAWELNDMLGNVWEWCSDIYDETVYGSYRVFRGGGFCDEARSVMATTRRRSHPLSFKIEDLGFRIARNLE